MTNENSFALHVLKDRCTGCGFCAGSCAYNAIRLNECPEIDPFACRLCGSCVQACPSEALQMDVSVSCAVSGPRPGNVWVLAEVDGQSLAPVTRELLGKAAALSEKREREVEAVLVGTGVSRLADELIAYGAGKVHLVDKPELDSFLEEDHARVVVELVKELHPEILLVGATMRGRGLSARIAAMLHTGLTADCTDLDIDLSTGLLLQVRPAFGGNLMVAIRTPEHRPQMASVRPGVMKALEADFSRNGEVVRHDLPEFGNDTRIRLVCESVEPACADTLDGSRIVVGVGRGVKDKETVERISRWAARIGAVVAGSRAAVEAGLIDARMQIGQTGHTISPDLYIAIGISGQIQHTAGISGARKILAVNPDRAAPIFNVADYGWAVPVEEALSGLMGED